MAKAMPQYGRASFSSIRMRFGFDVWVAHVLLLYKNPHVQAFASGYRVPSEFLFDATSTFFRSSKNRRRDEE